MSWPPSEEDFDNILNNVYNSKKLKLNELNTVLIYWDYPEHPIIFEPIHFAKTEYINKTQSREEDNTIVKICIGKED